MPGWLLLSLVALVAWSAQRVVSKMALSAVSTPQFYLLSAAVALPVYVSVLALDPPPASAFPGAFGLSLVMAVAFGVTTEAIRRGPVGRVSPITGASPALTALLAFVILDERVGMIGLLGIACATSAVAVLGYGRVREVPERGRWVGLALASVVLQGIGAFLAKVVVTPNGPSALLVTSAAVQLVVGFALLRRSGERLPELGSRLMRVTVLVLALAALATIGYLFALSLGPAVVIVPLVATSPAVAGLIGGIVLKERLTTLQHSGIALGLVGAVLLASQG